jgi:hypothetical protein
MPMMSLLRRENLIVLCVLLAIGLFACTASKKKKSIEKQTLPANVFTVPSIPVALKTPELRADYLMAHYWDLFPFADTTVLNDPAFAEQPFADFMNVLLQLPVEKSSVGIQNLMSKAEVNETMFNHFQSLAEKYLEDPNAPTRNESLYVAFLKSYLASSIVDEAHKIRPRRQLDLAHKNALGTRAANFNYTLENGQKGSLYALNSELTVIYFNNPGCPECRHTREKMLECAVLQMLQQEGRLVVLGLYPDTDLTGWKQHEEEHPVEWINAFDKAGRIKRDELYDLKAIPTIYLLDRKKTVLLKDPTFEELEWYLTNKVS